MRPIVSIVVPCHRARDTLPETVESVLAQTFADWELILVSDDGADYLAELGEGGLRDSRIRQHPLRTLRRGHVAARNRGLGMARGLLVADLDADDLWRPERLAMLAPLAHRYGAAQDALECFDDRGVIGRYGPKDGRAAALSPALAACFDMPFHLVARRELAGNVWFPHASYAPDPVRAAVLAARSTLVWLGHAGLRYRVHGQSMSQSVSGGWRVDASYGDILHRLVQGDAYGLTAPHLIPVIAGFRRKLWLNRRHMALRRQDPATPPFVAWVLSMPTTAYLGRPFG